MFLVSKITTVNGKTKTDKGVLGSSSRNFKEIIRCQEKFMKALKLNIKK